MSEMGLFYILTLILMFSSLSFWGENQICYLSRTFRCHKFVGIFFYFYFYFDFLVCSHNVYECVEFSFEKYRKQNVFRNQFGILNGKEI